MTRAEYERLGNWCELLGPWEMLEEERMSEKAMALLADQTGERLREVLAERDEARAAHVRCHEGWGETLEVATRYRCIARALLAETSLTPSEVRERWPEDAGWLLEGEG